jgi:2',3'-cyclic-nucleotide 2'-phosphodiesterase (5'-nucleotidase family)
MRAHFLISAAVALAACKNGDRSKAEVAAARADSWEPARVAEVYFSTEVDGYVEPCGCTTQPLGGVQRLASVIGRGRSERILIDAGNLLFPPSGVDDITREQHILKARMVARVYRQLGAVALNLAQSDLTRGGEFLKELQREGAVPLVSANVRPVNGGPTVARSFLRTVGGIKIGITGAATPEALAQHHDAFTVIEYAPAVRAEVKVLRDRGAELVIVLAHVGESGARELARAVPEIDVIIRAPGTPIERDPKSPTRVGDVIIAEAGSQGQHVGRMVISMGEGPAERPLYLDDAGEREVKRRRLLERKIKAYGMEIAAWSVDPTKAEAVKVKQSQIDTLKQDLASPMPEMTAPTKPHLRIDLVRLTTDVSENDEMTKLLEGYYSQLRALNAEKGDPKQCAPKDPKAPTYVGTQRCVECHEEEYEFWKKTKHASAWETLEKQNKHFDLTCIGCHTIGYQKPGGFCRLKDVSGREDVGCENCHGPGSIHSEDQDASSIVLKVPESTCASECHVPAHSDAFVYEKYLREITGPGHDLGEG